MRSIFPRREQAYISELFGVDDSNALSVHSSAPDGLHMVQLGVAEGQLLQFLIRAARVKSVVEVGTCVGFSAICMAMALPPEGHVYTIEKRDKVAPIAKRNIEKCAMTDKITVLCGDALDKLKDLKSASPFDMMFIDANKSGYCDYLDWAEANIKKGGLIVADNVFLFGTVFSDTPSEKVSKSAHTSMRNFNKRLSDKSNYLASIIPTEEGMLVAIKLR